MAVLAADTKAWRAFDSNGLPVPGARMRIFSAGTTTPFTVYTDEALTTPHAQPIIANATGAFPVIYLGPGVDVKVVMTDSLGVTLPGFPVDDIPVPVIIDSSGLSAAISSAQAQATRSFEWANEDEDTVVEGGEYSSKHHAAKSAASATEAAGSAAAAADSAAASADSASSASDSEDAAAASAAFAEARAEDAEDWAQDAEVSARAASATIFDSVANGLAGTGSGNVFVVQTTPGAAVYRNDDGAETFLGWIGELIYESVEALKSSTQTGFETGQIIRTRREGYAYIVVAAGTEDVVVATAGGVELIPDGEVYPDHFTTNSLLGITDMTSAINSAINFVKNRRATGATAVSAGEVRGTVHLRGVGYRITDSIIIDADGVVLRGQGRQSYIVRDDGDFDTLAISWGGTTEPNGNLLDNVEIRDMAFYSSAPMRLANGGRAHIYACAVRSLFVSNVYMFEPFVGFRLVGCADFILEKCDIEYDIDNYTSIAEVGSAGFVFERNGVGAINYSSSSSTGRCTQCRVFARSAPTSIYPNKHSFWIRNSDGIWFDNCYGRGGETGGFSVLPQDAQTRTTGVKLTDCWVDWTGGIAYRLGDSSVANVNGNHQVLGCRVYGGTGPQTGNFVSVSNANSVRIESLIGIECLGEGAIIAGDCSGVAISGSHLLGTNQSNGSGVIRIRDGAQNVLVDSCFLGFESDMSAGSNSQYALDIESSTTTDGVSFLNNTSSVLIRDIGNNTTGRVSQHGNSGGTLLSPGAGPRLTPSGGALTVTHERHEVVPVADVGLAVSSVVNNGSGFARISFSTAHGCAVGSVLVSTVSTGNAGYDGTHIVKAVVDADTVDTDVAHAGNVGAVGQFDRRDRYINRILGGDVLDVVTLFPSDSDPDLVFMDNVTSVYPNDRLRLNAANKTIADSFGFITLRKRIHELGNRGGQWAMVNFDTTSLT